MLARELRDRGHEVVVATVWQPGRPISRRSTGEIHRLARASLPPLFSPTRVQHHPPYPDPVTVFGSDGLSSRRTRHCRLVRLDQLLGGRGARGIDCHSSSRPAITPPAALSGPCSSKADLAKWSWRLQVHPVRRQALRALERDCHSSRRAREHPVLARRVSVAQKHQLLRRRSIAPRLSRRPEPCRRGR